MREYESFVYLDAQKTASTFIWQLLDRHCREREVRGEQHKGMEADCDRAKFYFISVRDPLDSYLSLYFYGVAKKGNLRAKLARNGADNVYDGTEEGFAKFLAVALHPDNARLLGEGYGSGGIAGLIGFQSYRHLMLALPDGRALLETCGTEDDVRAVYAARKLPSFTVRYESLLPDLETLLQGPLRAAMKDAGAAVEYMHAKRPINRSHRPDRNGKVFPVGDALRENLRAREWFLYETFGYR